MSQSIADILDKAADLIEPEGAWTQGELSDAVHQNDGNPTCFCAVGAIYEAARDDDRLVSAARDIVAQVLGFEKDALADWESIDEYPPVPRWNDAPERTQAEVVAKLREAAAKAREQGK